MAIIPNNNDPLQDYVSKGINPPLTQDGLVYNQVYAHTGVVDSIATTNQSSYADPNLSIINNSNNVLSFNQQQQTSWISSQDYGDPVNFTPVYLKYYVTNNTYFNNLNISILNVPCFVQLQDMNGNPLDGNSSFTINGGNDINTTTDWINLKYTATSTLNIPSNGYIQVYIARNKTVNQPSPFSNTLQSIAYSVGAKNFSIRLNIQQSTDAPNSSFIVQNRFGFIEQYNQVTYSGTNALAISGGKPVMVASDYSYWKSSPQPVGDSIVNLYLKVDSKQTIINKLYLDPIYPGCKFNLYFSTASGSGDPSTFTWSPVQRDFTLHKGLYELPNITCTYLKLEFTQLVPKPYDMQFDSVQRTINVFPYEIEQYYDGLESLIIDGATTNYYALATNNNMAPTTSTTASTLFGVTNNPNNNSNSSWPSIGNTPKNSNPGISSESFSVDPSMSYKLIDSNGNYNGQTYTQFLQRRFPDTRVHQYSQITINHSWHQAYFVGLQNIAAFYENNMYDDLRPAISSWISKNGNNTFAGQDNYNYITLGPDDTATTPWFSTIDTFKSFNIGAATTDWQSFLPDSQVLMNTTSNLLVTGPVVYPLPTISNLGTSSVVSVSSTASGTNSIATGSYPVSTNNATYLDANFLNGTTTWSGLGGTTLTATNVVTSGGAVVSGITVSGGRYSAAYNFTIPGVYSTSGTQNWGNGLGIPPYAAVGFGSYNAVQPSVSYYFLTNVQVSGATASGSNITFYTQFINPTTGAAISGTLTQVTGTSIAASGSNTFITVTGTNFTGGIPSNTLQLVISGTGSSPFNIYQLGIFTSPTTFWSSPSDRTNMRVSAVARMFFPATSSGTYRVSLIGTDKSGNQNELGYKQYLANTLPVNTWINVEVPGFSNGNYINFSAKVAQTNPSINETYYVSLLSPFYHPVRYEYITQSGATNWQPITMGINSSKSLISTVSGAAASGIQVRLTALDPNVFVCGLSVIPHYKQSPYYADTNINYIGGSKTNELAARRPIDQKPYFVLNSDIYPSRFSIPQIANSTVSYISI